MEQLTPMVASHQKLTMEGFEGYEAWLKNFNIYLE